MNIETKFKLGDKVKFTKEGGMSFIGVVSSMTRMGIVLDMGKRL